MIFYLGISESGPFSRQDHAEGLNLLCATGPVQQPHNNLIGRIRRR